MPSPPSAPAPGASATLEAIGQLGAVLDGLAEGVALFDEDWRFTWLNQAGAALAGRSVDELIGRNLWDEFPGSQDTIAFEEYTRVVEEQREGAFELFFGPLAGWFEVRAVPAGTGLLAFYRNVTERRRSAVVLSGIVRALTLLAQEAPLNAVLDAVTTMVEEQSEHGALASILVASEDGRTLRHGSAPSLPGWYNEAIDGLPIGPSVGSCGSAAHSRSQVAVADVLTDPRWESFRELAVAAGVRACWSTPVLAADGTVLGTFATYYRTPRAPQASDQQLVEQVTRAVAIAVGHERSRRAREVAAARDYEVAETLQLSLLTDAPAPPGVQVAVRYRPAVRTAEVGGDWYDAFALPDGGVGLVIGDVAGHDLAAASTMGQLRSMLRSLAIDSDDEPAAVLRRLDRLVDHLGITDLTTLIYGRLRRSPGTAETLEWANAGHPPPLLFLPDGSSMVLDCPVDPPIGISPVTPRESASMEIPGGSTLLLYTDGLVERRDQLPEESLQGLRDHVAPHSRSPLEDLCNHVVELAPEPDDDVALIAARLVGP
ncbi:MAG: SpoIIE family protein phosphatase [Acidimicrobiales bacterium]